MFRITALFLSSWMFISAAAAAPFNHTWRIKDLANADAETIELRSNRGKLLKRIDVKQMIYIYSVLQAIEEVGEIRAELLITDGDQPNAFATVGRAELKPIENETGEQQADQSGKMVMQGHSLEDEKPMDEDNGVDVNIIGVNFAMLDMLGLDVHMIAALIGHELGHLKLNHGEDHENHRRSDIRNAANTKYSRDNEREADYLGAIWAVEAGYDPAGAVRLQELLYRKTKHLKGGFSGSHPSSIERITKLKSLARRLTQ